MKIGGVDVRNMDSRELMRQVAFVFQDTRLFKVSILENIRMARPSATLEEILAAARAAQCGDILEKPPQGIDTVVGAQGVYLSGGEAQRIALARAILKDAPIVVLDEATAFADPENEALIQKAFWELDPGKDGSHDRPPALHSSGRRQHPGCGKGLHPGAGHPRPAGGAGWAVRQDVAGLPAGSRLEGWKGGSDMIRKLQHVFALSEKGARDFVKAVMWSFFLQHQLDAARGRGNGHTPVSVDILETGGDPSAKVLVYTGAAAAVLLLLFLLHYFQYASLYLATYQESAARRISLAETLRKLPLSFFSTRDLSDLTATMIADCSALDQMFSHYIPQLFASIFSTIFIGICMLSINWRMALAVLWVLPAAVLLTTGSKSSRMFSVPRTSWPSAP